jgi:hypothetical protein
MSSIIKGMSWLQGGTTTWDKQAVDDIKPEQQQYIMALIQHHLQ